MQSFLPKFIAKRLVKNTKYEPPQCTASAEEPINVLVVVGGGLCAVAHQDAACELIAEFLGGVRVFVECDDAASMPTAIEEAVTTNDLFPLSDDTRSIAAGHDASTARSLVLFFPHLSSAHGVAVLRAVCAMQSLSMRPLGCFAFEGSSTAMDDADLNRLREGWRLIVSSCAATACVLSVPMGCTVHDTYEVARVALLLLNKDAACCVAVGREPQAPPKPGSATAEEELPSMTGRSVSSRRIFNCRSAALEALLVIARNVLAHPEVERFRVLVTSSERFQVTLGSSPSAMKALMNLGYRTETGLRVAPAAGMLDDVTSTTSSRCIERDSTKLVMPLDVAMSVKLELTRFVSDVSAELERRLVGKGSHQRCR